MLLHFCCFATAPLAPPSWRDVHLPAFVEWKHPHGCDRPLRFPIQFWPTESNWHGNRTEAARYSSTGLDKPSNNHNVTCPTCCRASVSVIDTSASSAKDFGGVHSWLKNGSRMWSQATGTWAIWGSLTHWWKWTKPKEFPRHRKQRRLIPLNRDTQLKTLYLGGIRKKTQTIKAVKKPYNKPIKETPVRSQSHCPPAGAHFL